MLSKKRYLILALCCGLLSITQASTSLDKKQHQLEHLNQRITHLKQNIHLSEKQKQQINQQLADTEKNMGKSAKNLATISTELTRQLKKLTRTEAEQDRLKTELNKQQKIASNYIAAAYKLGRQQYLKVLLNQENPNTISRYITYYHYLTQARIKAMQDMHQTLDKMAIVSSLVRHQAQNLQSIKAVKEAEQQKLLQQKYHRQHLLNQLNASLTTSRSRLDKLVSDKNNLENVFKRLQSHFYFFVPGSNFSDTKAKLPWPVRHGMIIQRYNQPLANSSIRTSGILIKAPAGTQVHAVFKGKVVFANWLRGYGLLTIILHGSHYMTLYAHAESLYIKKGDSIEPGQLIATVGNSGGFRQNALYFEVRKNGIATNPIAWLRK